MSAGEGRSASNRGRTGTTPGNKGRFEGYDVLAQAKHWDETTRRLVLGRLPDEHDSSRAGAGGSERSRLQFFTPAEAAIAGVLVDHLLAQYDEPRVPVMQLVDERLAEGSTDGWRYEDMPEDGAAWRATLKALDEDALEEFGQGYASCKDEDQMALLQGVQDAKEWHGWSAEHVWSLWTRYACAAFYSHPWAWNEMGYGGPAYPRGYKVLNQGRREPWERPEVDAEDPVPWATRTEEVRKAHERRAPRPDTR
jgi:hypothetical protein